MGTEELSLEANESDAVSKSALLQTKQAGVSGDSGWLCGELHPRQLFVLPSLEKQTLCVLCPRRALMNELRAHTPLFSGKYLTLEPGAERSCVKENTVIFFF